MNGETVTRVRRGERIGTDRYNNPVYTLEETEVPGAAFDPGGSRETAQVGRLPVVTSPTLYWTTEVDARADDRWVVRGVTYEGDGRPALWRSPWTGGTSGTVVTLKLAEG